MRIVNIILSLPVVWVLGLTASTSSFAVQNDKTIPLASIRLFSDVYEKIKANAVTETTDEQLFDNAINGMLSNLDPYSELLDINRFNELMAFTDGDIANVGIKVAHVEKVAQPLHNVLNINHPSNNFPLTSPPSPPTTSDGNKWKVVAVTSRSSAAKAGLRVGDTLLRINGQPIDDMLQSDVEQALRGAQGTDIQVLVSTTSASKVKTKDLTLQCATVENYDVQNKLLAKNILYMQIKAFDQKTPQQIRQILSTLTPDEKSLIIDLRDNPGGVVSAAVEVANFFLPKNTLITKSSGRGEQDQIFLANQDEYAKGVNLILLINRYTASAAEIFAAALQDNNRANVLGQNSYGKAAIQKLIPLDDKHGLKLTVAMYQTPKGQNISGVGIQPNVLLLEATNGNKDSVLKTAIDIATAALQTK